MEIIIKYNVFGKVKFIIRNNLKIFEETVNDER